MDHLTKMQVIPKVGLGTWKSPKDETLINAVKYAIEEAGYRHLDCAACYENEPVVGTALHDLLSRGVVKREELWITSKLWCTKHRPDLVVVHPLGCLEGDLQLPGMMAVIIGDGDAHILAVDLKAALGAVEALDLP